MRGHRLRLDGAHLRVACEAACEESPLRIARGDATERAHAGRTIELRCR